MLVLCEWRFTKQKQQVFICHRDDVLSASWKQNLASFVLSVTSRKTKVSLRRCFTAGQSFNLLLFVFIRRLFTSQHKYFKKNNFKVTKNPVEMNNNPLNLKFTLWKFYSPQLNMIQKLQPFYPLLSTAF